MNEVDKIEKMIRDYLNNKGESQEMEGLIQALKIIEEYKGEDISMEAKEEFCVNTKIESVEKATPDFMEEEDNG